MQQREAKHTAAAWFQPEVMDARCTLWYTVPQVVLCGARSCLLSQTLLMQAAVERGNGSALAESCNACQTKHV